MKTRTSFTTPVGRLVSGSAHRARTKDFEGRPLIVKNGPRVGQPRVDFCFSLAIRKTDPGWPALDAAIKATAAADFGPTVPQSPNFAWKITDGDSAIPNGKGNRPCDREGHPGHWVLHFSGGTIPRCYKRNDQRALVECDASEIRTGFMVRVAGNVTGNNDGSKPGVYLNHDMIELIDNRPELVIHAGLDANEAFGDEAAYAPVAMPSAPTPAAVATTTPHTAFLAGPPAPPAAPAPERFAHGGAVYTREQLTAAGWNDNQINALPRA